MSFRSSRRLSKSQYSLRETEGSARQNLESGFTKICAPTTYKTIYDSGSGAAKTKTCMKAAPCSYEDVSGGAAVPVPALRRTQYVYNDNAVNSNILMRQSGGQGGSRKSSKKVSYAPVTSIQSYSYDGGQSYQHQAAINDDDHQIVYNQPSYQEPAAKVSYTSYSNGAANNSNQYAHSSGQTASYGSSVSSGGGYGGGSVSGASYNYGSGEPNQTNRVGQTVNYSNSVQSSINNNRYSGAYQSTGGYSQGPTIVNQTSSIANNAIRSSLFDGGENQSAPIVVQRTETDTESESEEEEEEVYETQDTFNENAYGNKYIQQNITTVGTNPANIKPLEGYSLVKQPSLDFTKLNLPPPNLNCFRDSAPPKSVTRVVKHPQVVVKKEINQNFETTKTVVNDNVTHHLHEKKVIININRNHWHTQRVVVKDNNYHHFLINNIIKVNDIHHQKIEKVRGEGKTFRDYKQTQRIEQPACQTGQRNLTPVEIGANSYGSSGVASSVGAAVTNAAALGASSLDAGAAAAAGSVQYNSNNSGYSNALAGGRASAVIEASRSTDSDNSVSRLVNQARVISREVNQSGASASAAVATSASNEPITSRQYFTHENANNESNAISSGYSQQQYNSGSQQQHYNNSSSANQYNQSPPVYNRRATYVPYRGPPAPPSQPSYSEDQPNGQYIARRFRQNNNDNNYGSSDNNNQSYSYDSYGSSGQEA